MASTDLISPGSWAAIPSDLWCAAYVDYALEGLDFTFVLVPALAVGAVWVWAIRRVLRSRAALAPWKHVGSWVAVPPDQGLLYRFSGPPFALGPTPVPTMKTFDHEVLATLHGQHRGYKAVAFQYAHRYRSSLSVTRIPRRYTCTVVSLGTPAIRPMLEVYPRAGRGAQDFDRAFGVVTDNPKFAADVLQPQLKEWLLADPRARHLRFIFQGATLNTWEEMTAINHANLGAMVDYLAEILSRVPALVWRS